MGSTTLSFLQGAKRNCDGLLIFWLAFVLTRPFGATLGDVLTKSHEKGGLDFGTVGSSAVLAGVLLALVVFYTIRQAPSERTPMVANNT